MSIKSRLPLINELANSVIIQGKKPLHGFIRGDRTIFWSLTRLPYQTIKFGKREVNALVYQSDCYSWNEANGKCQCQGNGHHTVCKHILAAYKEALRLAGFTVYFVENANHAYKLLNFGCSFVKIINSNGMGITLATKRNGHTQRDAFDNVKQLLDSNRIVLQKSGDIFPVAYRVELIRRSDDTYALRSGSVTSKPIIRYGRNYNSTEVDGQWKLTMDAEANWREFIARVLPGRVLENGSFQSDQERQKENLREYYKVAG